MIPIFMMQIEEKTPVEVCRTTRTNDAGIKINRGQAVRREGEKRRTKITKSKGNILSMIHCQKLECM